MCVLNHFNSVWLFVILWTVTCQAPLPMRFHRQEYWSGLPFPSPGHLPNPGIKPVLVLYNPVISITHQMVHFFFFFFFFFYQGKMSIVTITQSQWFTLCFIPGCRHSLYNTYNSLQFLTEYFYCPPNLLRSPTLLLTTTNLFIVCIVLPFPECHIVGIIP